MIDGGYGRIFTRLCHRFADSFAIAALACALAACSQPAGTPQDAALAKEQNAVATLKTKYKDIVQGTDVKDRTLFVYVDVDNLYSMDEDAEGAMKADALKRWESVWTNAHPHKHALLRLSMRDYYGKEIYAASARV